MSRKRYTPEQIISMLREAEVGLGAGPVRWSSSGRTLGVSEQSLLSLAQGDVDAQNPDQVVLHLCGLSDGHVPPGLCRRPVADARV